ncbi:MAG: polysaccharide deacetylase family protein [Verrucomicrobiota bacterium]
MKSLSQYSLVLRRLTTVLVAAGLVGVKLSAATAVASEVSQTNTTILKWKDGKQAVFLLAFDDSTVSQVKNVIPELAKRGIVGTFYINPGNGPYASQRKAWEKDVPGLGMEYGNHTFTHAGALSVAEFDREIEQCNEVIQKCFPNRKQPRLISFGRPGVPKVKWRISEDEVKQVLAKYHLIERPSFYGPPIHLKTIDEIRKCVDQAIAKGEMGHLDFHGVGGDWLVTPMEQFIALLDKLESCREQLWLTDAISWHKYLTERKSAEIKEVQSDAKQIQIQLTCKSDPTFYDYPLSLATKVPPTWKECIVIQGSTKTNVTVTAGTVRYEIIPITGEILLKPAR